MKKEKINGYKIIEVFNEKGENIKDVIEKIFVEHLMIEATNTKK